MDSFDINDFNPKHLCIDDVLDYVKNNKDKFKVKKKKKKKKQKSSKEMDMFS